MEELSVYLACGIGAGGMYLLLAPKARAVRLLGAIIALGAFAWLLARALTAFGPSGGDAPDVLYYVFALIALASAGRMVTHSRPVYSALYFVMVVLSSAAIFLLLEAEFMAFALIIVYAGAILITYLFVLMLAQQAPTEDQGESAAPYDRIAREPAAAVGVGFLMLALLGQVIFNTSSPLLPAAGTEARRLAMVEQVNLLPDKRQALVDAFRQAAPDLHPDSTLGAIGDDRLVFILPVVDRPVELTFAEAGLSEREVDALIAQNIETVGMALVYTFPVSLELAGVILLMAMFGAVVLSRRQIELGEDEKREAAGMAPLSADADEENAAAVGRARP